MNPECRLDLGRATGLGAAFATNVVATGLFILLGAAGAFALFRIWSATPEQGGQDTR